MHKSLLALTLLAVGLAACASAGEDQLRTRAAFDMQCDESKLKVSEIDDRTMGVRGCGQRATYVESCDGPRGGWSTKCTWVLNSDSKRGGSSAD